MLRGDKEIAVTDEQEAVKSFIAATWDRVRIGRGNRKARAQGRAQIKERRNELAARQGSRLKERNTGDDNHVSVPAVAVNRAATAHELEAISRHVQGYVLVNGGQVGISTYALGARTAALSMPEERRRRIIAMHSYVNQRLPPDMLRIAHIVVDQVLQARDVPAPTIAEVGHEITQSHDERVRKGGVVGYYRALFQAVHALQREWLISDSVKRIKARDAANG